MPRRRRLGQNVSDIREQESFNDTPLKRQMQCREQDNAFIAAMLAVHENMETRADRLPNGTKRPIAAPRVQGLPPIRSSADF